MQARLQKKTRLKKIHKRHFRRLVAPDWMDADGRWGRRRGIV